MDPYSCLLWKARSAYADGGYWRLYTWYVLCIFVLDTFQFDLYTWADHLIPGLIFFSGKLYVAKWQHSETRGNSVQVYVQNRRSASPRIHSVEALGWTSTTACVAFHDGGESAVACVHWFLFPSGENWCWNVRNAASSFRRVLPKSIRHLIGIPVSKVDADPLKMTPARQAFHLPHRGDRGTCARNRSCWLTSDYQRGCRRS